MMDNKILVLKKDVKLKNGLELPKNSEIQIVMGVVYMGGYPVPQNIQTTMLNWVKNNPNLFIEKIV